METERIEITVTLLDKTGKLIGERKINTPQVYLEQSLLLLRKWVVTRMELDKLNTALERAN